jgi:hypothetical protein
MRYMQLGGQRELSDGVELSDVDGDLPINR